MKKNYVLDTNVLLHDPRAIFKFEDNDVVIPIFVIEEVDQFKREGTERGRNARAVCRYLDELREAGGSLSSGVPILKEGGMLRVWVQPHRNGFTNAPRDLHSQDDAILQTAIEVSKNTDVPTVFVTMDTNLRIRADAVGVHTETYENQRVEMNDLEGGLLEKEVPGSVVDQFFHDGKYEPPADWQLAANACISLRDIDSASHTALGRYHADKNAILPLRVPALGVMGLRPRNREQTFALELLLDDSIRLVTVMGKAGTGKTLLALAAGLQRTVEDEVYSRMLVSRPVIPLGRDVGFLPGDIDDKLNPWMQPIFDNLEFLFTSGNKDPKKRDSGRSFVDLLDRGLVQVEPLTYIRGRSLPQQYLIVDEAQNLTPHEVKTIITRCGEGTKIVLTGDPFQIDNPYVDSASNGLSVAAHRFRGQQIAGQVVMTKGERSDLAELAANLL